ncbi:MAG TPA: DUF4232 domain-containing protein [Ilumatobacteraceae bacterium]|jgi:hypothetical protein
MTTIDEIGRRAGAAARAQADNVAAARVESGLERLRVADRPTAPPPRRGVDVRRLIAVGTAAALVAAAVIALVVNIGGHRRHELVPASPSTDVADTPTTVVATNPLDTVGATPTTIPAVPAAADAIAVRHDALPAAFPARSFLGMTDQTHVPYVAIGDNRIVLVDPSTPTATLIDPFAPTDSPQPVQLDVSTTGYVAAGPGDVLYAVVQGDVAEMSLDAIALSGDRAGKVVASAPVNGVAFAEAPANVLGHGADGIIDRRTGATLLGYVDETGAPTSIGRKSHVVSATTGPATGDVTVGDPDGTHSWHLTIDRDPTSPGSPDGEPLPAPSSHGGAVVWTTVGPPDDSTSDNPTATEPVVAVLAADGTGTWYSLTDGWKVAASDLDGTILARLSGGTLEFARLDPPQRFDFLDQPAQPHQRVAFAATIAGAPLTANACTLDDLDVVPTADGAGGTVYGTLYVRNKNDQPCAVDGAPDVALLDGTGAVVSSSDPTLLDHPSTAPLVLVRDSWAVAQLGPVASNVCGGNQSSQFKVSLAGAAVTVPFDVGGPIVPDQCTPSGYQPPGPGTLAVQPFESFAAVEVPSPLDQLTIAIDAATSARAGDVFKYDIVMTASTDGPVELGVDTCPIFTETLATASAQLMLNCNGSDGILIGAGESVRFHLELTIPANAAAGPATLSWTPTEPAGAEVTTNVTINT